MRVIGLTETQSGVIVTGVDESTYFGHLVVGADGAYSATRHILYSSLKTQGLLPESDMNPLYVDKQCVVGKKNRPYNITQPGPQHLSHC
jgi:2-polyprenyl-6-methoxyphenol hydroxylase-like FAD-dependent oxidoreductase